MAQVPARGWFGQRIPARLGTWPTPEELARMIRHPSAYAPTAEEVLVPSGDVESALPVMEVGLRRALDAVLAHPDDDAPRLAFAELLAKTDPVRAEWIRQQLKDSQLCRTVELDPVFVPFGARDVVYRRGFAEALSISGRGFLTHAVTLFELTPLREVRFVAVRHLLRELVKCPQLGRLRKIDLSRNRIGEAGVRELAQAALPELRELDLSENGVGAAGLGLLAEAAWAKSLEILTLSRSDVAGVHTNSLRGRFGNRLVLA